jgi:glycerol-3-phosphate acyltransferase PlsY
MSWTEYLHSADWNQAGGICLFAYILGCFTSGYYLVRLFAHQDLREVGSGSVGARNVARVLGKTGFFVTVLFDFGKGALVVWTAEHFTKDARVIGFAMLAVVVGHIWPAQLRFRGGKGVATSLGALLVFDPQVAVAFVVLFAGLAAIFRRVTLPAMFALSCLPVAGMCLERHPDKVILYSLLSALVILAHRKNLTEKVSQFLARRHLDPKPDQSRL